MLPMTIYFPSGLPSARKLWAEGMTVSDASAAPGTGTLRIGLLNLMPDKPATELHIARQLAAPRLTDGAQDIELILLSLKTQWGRTTSRTHIESFYRTVDRVRHAGLDGLIVTGAPVETLDFDQVTYWTELRGFLDWARENVAVKLFICWGAQAALYHYHGVPKYPLRNKAFGIFQHQVFRHESPIVQGLGPQFPCPVSRHTEVRWDDLNRAFGLHVAAASHETGPGLVEDMAAGCYYMFNHLEYEADTLAKEYRRDRQCGSRIALPANYFPGDDPTAQPRNTWAGAARRFYTNWIGQVAARATERNLARGTIISNQPARDALMPKAVSL